MKKYVLDTTFFAHRKYYSSIFTSFWEAMDEAAQNGSIHSVDEVKKELEAYEGEQENLFEWVRANKHIFTEPQDEIEQKYLAEILKLKKFRQYGERQTKAGHHWADPHVIAKAMRIDGTVVTEESFAKQDKKGKARGLMKIPDVCKKFDVPCISDEQFMKDQGWQF